MEGGGRVGKAIGRGSCKHREHWEGSMRMWKAAEEGRTLDYPVSGHQGGGTETERISRDSPNAPKR